MSLTSEIFATVYLEKDNTEHTIPAKVARFNGVINNIIDEIDSNEIIPLVNLENKSFLKIMEWCEHYKDCEPFESDFDKQFMDECLKTDNPNKKLDNNFLSELLMASDYLDNTIFKNLCIDKVIECIRGKEIEEIHADFGICTTCRVTEEDREGGICEHGLDKFGYTEEEEKELKKIKPYEEWQKNAKNKTMNK